MPAEINTNNKLDQLGELLADAARLMGSMSPEELKEIDNRTNGRLHFGLALALECTELISRETRENLKARPPKGFMQLSCLIESQASSKPTPALPEDFQDQLRAILHGSK